SAGGARGRGRAARGASRVGRRAPPPALSATGRRPARVEAHYPDTSVTPALPRAEALTGFSPCRDRGWGKHFGPANACRPEPFRSGISPAERPVRLTDRNRTMVAAGLCRDRRPTAQQL